MIGVGKTDDLWSSVSVVGLCEVCLASAVLWQHEPNGGEVINEFPLRRGGWERGRRVKSADDSADAALLSAPLLFSPLLCSAPAQLGSGMGKLLTGTALFKNFLHLDTGDNDLPPWVLSLSLSLPSPLSARCRAGPKPISPCPILCLFPHSLAPLFSFAPLSYPTLPPDPL